MDDQLTAVERAAALFQSPVSIITEIIETRSWEPLGFETFYDGWAHEFADTRIGAEVIPHVAYQMFAEGKTPDQVSAVVVGVGEQSAKYLKEQWVDGVPAGAASTRGVGSRHE